MNSKDKKNKKRYRFLFILSLLAILGLVFLIYSLDTKLKALETSDTVPVFKFDELNTEAEKLKELISIDDLWLLDKQPKKALSRLEKLKFSDDNMNKKVDEKIKRINDILRSQNDDELTKINLRTELSEALEANDSLLNQLDSLEQYFKQTLSQAKIKTDSLEGELDSKTRQLGRSDALKVISFKSDKRILVHYIGETKNDVANGSGVGVWANGSIYRGEWSGNKPDGKGEYKWADGARYKGDFDMGNRSGEGIFYYATGEKYEGEFKMGLRSGKGTLYDIDGNVSFEGEWEKDKPIQ